MLTDMPRPHKPYLLRETTRHEKTVWYVRRGAGPRIRIKAEYGTDDFNQQYEAAIRGETPVPQAEKSKSGSLRWLYERYHESADWAKLKESTRGPREAIFKHILAKAGDKRFTAVNRASVEKLRDDKADTPNQARCYLDAMRGLFGWAKKDRHVKIPPKA